METGPEFPAPPEPNRRNRRRWLWVLGGALALGLGVIIAAVATNDPEEETESTLPEHLNLESDTPTPSMSAESDTPTPSMSAEVIYPETFYWTVPDVVGMSFREAKASIQESIAAAGTLGVDPVGFGDAYNLRVSVDVWSERESKEEEGTVLAIHKFEPGQEITLTPPDPLTRGDRVTMDVNLLVAIEPIRFRGDSIYIDGSGSAFVTWLDSNFNIHQKTVALPAWFRVPAGVDNYSAQRSLGDGGSIECQLRYDDEVYARSRSSGPYAICSVTA